MGSPLSLRDDHDSSELRRLARRSRHAGQSRRLPALAAIYDGASRGEAALLAGTDRQSIRDWVVRFNADGLVDRHGGGQKAHLTPKMLSAQKTRLEEGPIPAVHGVVRWRMCDLCGWPHENWGITLSETRLGQIIRREGFRLLTVRPRHYRQDTEAQDIFKKSSPVSWRQSGPDVARDTLRPSPRARRDRELMEHISRIWQDISDDLFILTLGKSVRAET